MTEQISFMPTEKEYRGAKTCNSSAMFTSNSDEWSTPQDVFDELNNEFHFNLDPCCTQENAKCRNYFTKEQNGLKQSWGGTTCSAIHLIARQRSGLRSVIGKGARIIQRQCFLYQAGQILNTSTILFIKEPRSGSLREGFGSTGIQRTLRFRAWQRYLEEHMFNDKEI